MGGGALEGLGKLEGGLIGLFITKFKRSLANFQGRGKVGGLDIFRGGRGGCVAGTCPSL